MNLIPVSEVIKEQPFVGHFFHSISKETRKVEWQGVVIGHPEPYWYVVQLFEWCLGEPSIRRLVHIDDMATWLFYPDAETMRFSYDQGTARKGGPYRDK